MNILASLIFLLFREHLRTPESLRRDEEKQRTEEKFDSSGDHGDQPCFPEKALMGLLRKANMPREHEGQSEMRGAVLVDLAPSFPLPLIPPLGRSFLGFEYQRPQTWRVRREPESLIHLVSPVFLLT